MATGFIPLTNGAGDKYAATHSISEDAKTKEIQRIAESTSGGTDASFGPGSAGSGTKRVIVGAGSYTDKSTTGTGAGTKQVMAQNTSRIHAIVQNPQTAVSSIWVNFGANASSSNSIELAPGEMKVFPCTDEIRCLAPSSAVIVAKELA